MRLVVAAVVAAVVGLAACHSSPPATATPLNAPAAPACPAPRVRSVQWIFAADSAGFTIALPRGFEERPSGGSSRHWESGTDFQHYMSSGIIHGNLGLSGYRRPYQAALMLDYSECVEDVQGYRISIQSWRTPNGTFRNFQRLDRYDVFAIWEVGPGVYFYESGGTYSRAIQEQLLVAVRRWRHRPSP